MICFSRRPSMGKSRPLRVFGLCASSAVLGRPQWPVGPSVPAKHARTAACCLLPAAVLLPRCVCGGYRCAAPWEGRLVTLSARLVSTIEHRQARQRRKQKQQAAHRPEAINTPTGPSDPLPLSSRPPPSQPLLVQTICATTAAAAVAAAAAAAVAGISKATPYVHKGVAPSPSPKPAQGKRRLRPLPPTPLPPKQRLADPTCGVMPRC
jgi:hypothetical protein